MVITNWPPDERPREKLLKKGAQYLSDAELLAIVLRTGLPGKTAVDLARELISEYGGLRPLLQADKHRFCRSLGLGTAKYAMLQATLEMSRRHMQEQLTKGEALTTPQAAATFLTSQLRDHSHEVFACLFLDNRHRRQVSPRACQGRDRRPGSDRGGRAGLRRPGGSCAAGWDRRWSVRTRDGIGPPSRADRGGAWP